MIVLLLAVIGLWSWTALVAGVLVQRANQRADDADARRFKALELLNEEQQAHARDREQWEARLALMHEVRAAADAELVQIRGRMHRLERLAKQLGLEVPDPPKPTRVM